MRHLIAAAALLSMTMLTACDPAFDQCAQADKAAECRQVTESGGDVNDYLLYGLTGYMIGSTMSGGRRQSVIVADPNYRGYRRPVPSYVASPSFVRNRAAAASATTPTSSSTRTTSTIRYSSPAAYRTTYRPTTFRSAGRR